MLECYEYFPVTDNSSKKSQLEAPAVGLAHWIEEGVHSTFFYLTDVGHEFTEATFRECALLEPEKVFFREVENRDSPGWVFFFAEHSEGHVGGVDFQQ